jgi:hypothetical protein
MGYTMRKVSGMIRAFSGAGFVMYPTTRPKIIEAGIAQVKFF